MEMKFVFLTSILFALSVTLLVPGISPIQKAKASVCHEEICVIHPEGSPGQGDPQSDCVFHCYEGCTTCCNDWCPNALSDDDPIIVGQPSCDCTISNSREECEGGSK